MDSDLKGYYPGNTNVEFIYLTGAIISWWARIEGVMIRDIWALRTWPFSNEITQKRDFPTSGKAIITQWRALIENGCRFFEIEGPNLAKTVNEAIALVDHLNTLSHSFWPYGQTDLNVLELHWLRRDAKSSGGVRQDTYRATLSDLDKITPDWRGSIMRYSRPHSIHLSFIG